jgi:hypothetical protein
MRAQASKERTGFLVFDADGYVRRLIRRLPLTLLVGRCDSGRAALRTFVRVRLELPANR